MSSEHAHAPRLKEPGKLKLPNWYFGLATVMSAVGFGTFGYLLKLDPHRAWGAYLIGLFFSLIVALSGPFFVALQYLSSAGWSVTVRRIPEAMAAYLIPAGILAGGVFFGAHDIYHWTHPDAVAHDMVLYRKAPYLNLTRMGIFMAIAFVAWVGLSTWITRNSRRQDVTGDATLTRRNAVLSAVFMVIFALTFSTAGFDLIMSLEPHWGSTMWAVYMFSMLMQSGMALITLIVVLLRKTGKLEGFVTDYHIHDLGKLTFAFTVFYAYIAFCQFMLIWYANLPEETAFFMKRFAHGWGMLALVIPFGKFLVPFLTLLPSGNKHNPGVLIPIALWIHLATVLELWWIVMPAISQHSPVWPGIEILVVGGFLGVFLMAFGISLQRHSIVPVKDPRINESIHHHAW